MPVHSGQCWEDQEGITDLQKCAWGSVQVAKSIQMSMGVHDKDVVFFLAADEPATYLQVQASPLHVPCSRITSL